MRAAGYDANFLLNVGPTPQGTFQPEVVERLEAMGEWTSEFGETIYGTRGGPMPPQSWGVMTSTPTALYVHVLDVAATKPSTKLVLPDTLGLDVKKATVFGTDREVAITIGPGGELELSVPSDAVHPIDTIVVLGL